MFLLCSGLIGVSDGTDSKRLLLNDPTIFQDRLNRMESTLAKQAITIQQQAAEISQLKSYTSASKGTILQVKLILLQDYYEFYRVN